MYYLLYALAIFSHIFLIHCIDEKNAHVAESAQQIVWRDDVAITPERILLHACCTRNGFICTRNRTELIEHYLKDKVLTIYDVPLSQASPYAEAIFQQYKEQEQIKINSLGAMHDKDVLFGCTCLSASLSSAGGCLLSSYTGDPCAGAIVGCSTFAWLLQSIKPALDVFMLKSIKKAKTKLKID